MNIEQLTKKNEAEWSGFINLHPYSSIYHTLEWKQILEKTYKYKPYYLLAKNNQDEITGILPLLKVDSFIFGNRLVSLPFSYCGGIISNNNSTTTELIDYTISKTIEHHMSYLELKQGISYLDNIKLVKSDNNITSILHLSKNKEDIWNNIKKDKKRGIKKAKKKGLVVREMSNKKELEDFYTMVLETRKRQGVPPYPFSFFENMYKYMKNNLKIFFSYYNDSPIACGIFQLHKDNMLYGYGMTRKEKTVLQLYPMNLLIWEAIEWAYENDYKTFDFGITPKKHESLLYFKSSWGTENITIPYYYYLNNVNHPPDFDPTSPKYKLMTNIWKKIPITVAKNFGPYLLRHVG